MIPSNVVKILYLVHQYTIYISIYECSMQSQDNIYTTYITKDTTNQAYIELAHRAIHTPAQRE